MELTSPQNIKEILAKYETRPSKGLGQNFLIDKNVLNKIIEASEIKPSDVILEVGPGIGTLTQELAKKSKKVVAIEKSETMIKILEETLKEHKNVEVINGDILKSEPELLSYKLIANIPYYLTSPLIRKFLESPPTDKQPQEMVLMLQKEVAQRICARPPEMSILAVSVQFYADAKIISYVSKNCFWPAPNVDSAIIKIIPHQKYKVPADAFFKVVKAGFSQPRKQLGNNLAKILKIDRKTVDEKLLQNNIRPTQRAETLTIPDWIKLTNTF